MPAQFGMCLQNWPAADREAWTKATAKTDFFATDAHAAHWSAKTRYQALTAYGRWLAFLARSCPLALQEDAAQRASKERLTAYLDSVSQRVVAMSVAAEINHLCLALRAITPGIDLDWLLEVQRRWTRRARPRERRSKILDARRVYSLGVTLMTAATSEPESRIAARLYRDGLLVALLVSRPLRRKNLAELEVGTHLLPVAGGYVLVIPDDATKSGQPLEYDVPDDLVPYLERYLDDYRNRFPNADRHAGLWPSSKGGRLGADAIYDILCKRTRATFGEEISPHWFRTIAATTLVHDAPAQSLMASALLGHASPETAPRHYIRSDALDASRRYADLIADIRKA